MDDRFNTIAGWTLFAGIVALGGAIVTGEMFHAERPETMGYPIEGVVEEGEDGGAAAPVPIAALMATANAEAGQAVFAKCAACHTINQGGANGIGPNLYGTMGRAIAGTPGFAFSDALKSKGGSWDFENMSAWLASPRTFAPGTKMTFAGLGKPEDRANIIAYLNQQSASPLPLPTAPVATPPVEGEGDKAADTGAAGATPATGAPSVDPNAAVQAADDASN